MNERKTGQSMGIIKGITAAEMVSKARQREDWLMTHILTDEKPSLCEANAKLIRGETLLPNEAALVAELHSIIAYVHFLQIPPSNFNAEINGQKINFAPSVYRVKTFFRMVEFLRLTGVLKEESFSGNKLILGAGPIIADVYPFAFTIGVNRPEKINLQDLNLPTAEAAQALFRYWQEGTISFSQRSGRITCVDTDEFLLKIGAKWVEFIGVSTTNLVANARDLVHRQKPDFQKTGISMVIGARIDPLMIGGDPQKPNFQKTAISFGNALVDIVKKGRERKTDQAPGQIFFTAGSGKRGHDRSEDYHHWQEYKERMRAMGAIKDSFNGLGPIFFQDMTKIPFIKDWFYPPLSDLVVLVANAGCVKIRE